MRKNRFLSVVVLVVLLLGTGSMVIARSPSAVGDHCRSLGTDAATPMTGWQTLEDGDYGFTLEHPIEWEPAITIDVHDSDPKPESILRRYTFIGDLGGLDIDVSAAHGMDLSAWLKWVGEITAPFPVTEANARVAGYPAVAFAGDDGALSVLINDGQYVYWFWYTAIYSEDGLQVYQRMLNTFRLPGSTTTGAQIPQSVMQSARQVLESRSDCTKSATDTTASGCYSVYNQGCCGLSSIYCSTYFPCSRDSSTQVDKGNCTWYVCYCYGQVPFRGDAATWWDQVPRYPEWTRGSYPGLNKPNIAWWGAGHVAFVPNGSNPTVIYEMNWCLTCARQRPPGLPGPQGYIWKVNSRAYREQE
jgi:hypothetical protein